MAKGVFTCSILAGIVTILVSIMVTLTSIEPMLEKCGHLWQYLEILHLQVNRFFKYYINTGEFYHNTNYQYFQILLQYLWVLNRWIHPMIVCKVIFVSESDYKISNNFSSLVAGYAPSSKTLFMISDEMSSTYQTWI